MALTLRLSLQRHHSCGNKLVEKLKLKTGFWFTKLISSPEPKIIKHDVDTNVYLACTERTQCENVLHHVYQQKYTPKLKCGEGVEFLGPYIEKIIIWMEYPASNINFKNTL